MKTSILTAGAAALAAVAASSVFAQAPQPQQRLPATATPQQLSTACDSGRDGWACDELGRRFMGGEGVIRNDARALELLTRSCGLGNAMGCARLGFIHESGRATVADAPRAAELYGRGCEGGEPWGCTRLGLLYANGRGVKQDDGRAVGLYRRGCDAGEPAACTNLGMMMQTARGAARDDARSAALYRIACDKADGVGCAHLGLMYDLGFGVAKSEATAIGLYRKACEIGDGGGGCLMLGFAYANGRGGLPKDSVIARQMFQRGCDTGEANACEAAREAAAPPANSTPPPAPPPAPTSPAPATTPATASSMVFRTSQAELFWQIKPERVSDFEAAWKAMTEGLAKSAESRFRAAVRGLTLFRITGPTALYVVHVDPVIAGVSYQPGSLLTDSGALPEPQSTNTYRTIADSSTSLSWLEIEEVRLRGVNVPARTIAADASSALGRSADNAWALAPSGRGEIIWTVKTGQGPAFERFWQEVVAGMARSTNERLRQAAQGLRLWKAAGTTPTYLLRIDRVIDGIRYDPAALVYGTFARPDADELYAQVSTWFDKVNVLALAVVQGIGAG